MADESVPPNPYRPGAGHIPPHLAGRKSQMKEFKDMLRQDVITQNVVLTGLRGVGKTVLMTAEYKNIAIEEKWVWVGNNFSESAFVDEKTLCQRILTDLSLFTSQMNLSETKPHWFKTKVETTKLDFDFLTAFFESVPGLLSDKLKATLEYAWELVKITEWRGVVFACDEAQVVQDRRDKDQFPLALLLETFQSLQAKGVRFMLLLTGLPTLFPKLVESRTFAERMFKVQEISKLSREESTEAIEVPMKGNPYAFNAVAVKLIIETSGGYPYFIQYICRDSYDFFATAIASGQKTMAVPMDTILRKLDNDFFSGRWKILPDRQRDLLFCISSLEECEVEFSIAEAASISKTLVDKIDKPFRSGDINQMMPRLLEAGLVYKNRHGKYSFAVPLYGQFVQRQYRFDN